MLPGTAAATGSNSTGVRHVSLQGADWLSSSPVHQGCCKDLQNAQVYIYIYICVCIQLCVYVHMCVCIQIPELFLHF